MKGLDSAAHTDGKVKRPPGFPDGLFFDLTQRFLLLNILHKVRHLGLIHFAAHDRRLWYGN